MTPPSENSLPDPRILETWDRTGCNCHRRPAVNVPGANVTAIDTARVRLDSTGKLQAGTQLTNEFAFSKADVASSSSENQFD